MSRAKPRTPPTEHEPRLSVLPPIRVEREKNEEKGLLFALQGLYRDFLASRVDCAGDTSLHQPPPNEER
jgi:hypothetical protein